MLTHLFSVESWPDLFMDAIAVAVFGAARLVETRPASTDPQSCPIDSVLLGMVRLFVYYWILKREKCLRASKDFFALSFTLRTGYVRRFPTKGLS